MNTVLIKEQRVLTSKQQIWQNQSERKLLPLIQTDREAVCTENYVKMSPRQGEGWLRGSICTLPAGCVRVD
jgi:hypothetical protein